MMSRAPRERSPTATKEALLNGKSDIRIVPDRSGHGPVFNIRRGRRRLLVVRDWLREVRLRLSVLAGAGAFTPNVSPNQNGLPALDAVQKGVGGVMALGLIACVAWFAIGAIRAGMAGRTNNYQQTADGKQQMLWGAVGAFAIGAAGAVITFAFKAGGGVH